MFSFLHRKSTYVKVCLWSQPFRECDLNAKKEGSRAQLRKQPNFYTSLSVIATLPNFNLFLRNKVSKLDVTMGKSWLWVLSLLLLNSLVSCGHAEDALLIIEPKWSPIYLEEFVTLKCDMREGKDADWLYKFDKNRQPFLSYSSQKQFTFQTVRTAVYQCTGFHPQQQTYKTTNEVTVTVSEFYPKATLRAAATVIRPGRNVTLSCSVDSSDGWKFDWFRQASIYVQAQGIKYEDPHGVISVSLGGLYQCRGRRGTYFTHSSNAVIITRVGPVLSRRQHSWPQIFRGETITLRCDVQDDGDTTWTYEWGIPGSGTLTTITTTNEYVINSISEAHSGLYYCKSRKGNYSSEWSDAIRLTVLPKPTAKLNLDQPAVGGGFSVTLTCSVNPTSAGWTYYWYRGEKTTGLQTTEHTAAPLNRTVRVSQTGRYWCRGGRGNPVYFTEYSEEEVIKQTATVSLHPNWPEIYRGETVTVRCDTDGADAGWEYEWRLNRRNINTRTREHRISAARSQDSGQYECKGKIKSAPWSETEWSEVVTLTVSDADKPKAVLTVSPSWLSPGAPVTLHCEVKDPEAGWRFYWFQAVPKLPENAYSYELLRGSSSGTEQDSYIVHGLKHTVGFMCRTGRGDPEFLTNDSQPKFVWSGDFPSPVSLTVVPNRVQHFTSQSLSLHCEGNSEWTVKKFTQSHQASLCDSRKRSRCEFTTTGEAVYWCETAAGQFSNAINITAHPDIILLSPAHPVTEGDSVTLGCELTTQTLLSNTDFYQNDRIIRNNTNGTMTFAAVSKSDEGLYKCKSSKKESAQSWMEVKLSRPEQSFLVPLVIGVVTGALLMILLLLLCHYRKLKGLQKAESNYSSIHLNGTDKKGKPHEAMGSSVCFHVDAESPADENITYAQLNLRKSRTAKKTNYENVTYAQINTNTTKSKAKKNKEENGKTAPAFTEETLYSEV